MTLTETESQSTGSKGLGATSSTMTTLAKDEEPMHEALAEQMSMETEELNPLSLLGETDERNMSMGSDNQSSSEGVSLLFGEVESVQDVQRIFPPGLMSNLATPTPIAMDDPTLAAASTPDEHLDVSVPSETSKAAEEMSTCQVPKQPILGEYPAKKFGNETFARRFQPEWYKMYPWLSYEVDKDQCVCFACAEFGKDTSFVYRNWKKSSKLTKHGKSENHIRSMTRWAQFKTMQKKNTSVLQQLDSAHQEQVASNRQYLQVIIECLMFTAQQNLATRGHEESQE